MAARRIRIHGRVQGVYYRAWTVETATELGLNGWVRNRSDGSVEALVVGEDEKIEKLIEACRQGPPNAKVDKVESIEAEAEVLKGFVQRETY